MKPAKKKVIKYRLHWSMTLSAGSLELHLEDNTEVSLSADDAGKLVVWVDLLRNDAPVYYWKNEAGEGLASGWEAVVEPEDPPWASLDGQQK